MCNWVLYWVWRGRPFHFPYPTLWFLFLLCGLKSVFSPAATCGRHCKGRRTQFCYLERPGWAACLVFNSATCGGTWACVLPRWPLWWMILSPPPLPWLPTVLATTLCTQKTWSKRSWLMTASVYHKPSSHRVFRMKGPGPSSEKCQDLYPRGLLLGSYTFPEQQNQGKVRVS